MTLPTGSILLITGIMAAGKSTIAQRVAERLPRSVHLRGDVFRRMIVNGRAGMQPEFTDEDWQQLRLRYRIAASAAESYCEAGFAVVYQDVIVGPILQEVVDLLKNMSLHVIVLCPSPEAALQRDHLREKTAYTGWTPHDLDRELRVNTPHLGLWLDTSDLSVEETVDTIFTQLEHARIVR